MMSLFISGIAKLEPYVSTITNAVYERERGISVRQSSTIKAQCFRDTEAVGHPWQRCGHPTCLFVDEIVIK